MKQVSENEFYAYINEYDHYYEFNEELKVENAPYNEYLDIKDNRTERLLGRISTFLINHELKYVYEIQEVKTMSEIIINKEQHECPPAVAAYVKELKAENNHLLEKIQSFYKNEKLDLIERGRFLRELNDEIDENAKCRMAVTADELIEFIEEFEPVTEGELVARLSELEEENARLEEGYQKSVGVIAATDCVEGKDKAVEHGRWIHITRNEYKCSLCEARIWVKVVPLKGYTSCWHCGVKMDLKDGESE